MKREHIRAVLLMVAVLLTASCDQGGSDQSQAGGGMPAMPPAEVEVTILHAADLSMNPEYPGRTQGSREVEVRARVGGVLLERKYEEGAFVNQGDILFMIDPEPYQLELNRAEAEMAQAQARVKAAERNWSRASELFKQSAVSERARDEALSEVETARAGMGVSKAEVATAKLNLDYTQVVAPISGVTSREAVSEGSLVTAMGDSSLLTRITQLDPIYVNFAYPDSEFIAQRDLMAEGKVSSTDQKLDAVLKFSNGEEYPVKGEIDFTGTTIDPQTGTVQARATFANPNGVLLPGQFVRLTATGLMRHNAITVPQDVVMQGPQGKFVYTLDSDNKAQIAPIEIGDAYQDQWIVESGLKDGDVVITGGVLKVQPGAPVKPTAAPEKPQAPAAADKPAVSEETAPVQETTPAPLLPEPEAKTGESTAQ